MTDTLNENGLQTKTLSELITELEDGYKKIYGNDTNVASNSPDGQTINIYSQSGIDERELWTEIYNSFNPDTAQGTSLDNRVVINNIQRRGGTYTIQPIDVTVDRTVELNGLDADFNNPDGTGYTIQDNEGNQFILVDTTTFTAGATSANFRAKNIGEVLTTIGTITNPVTIVLGVTDVNNSSGALETGENQETDAELRVRRQQSVAINSQGYLDGLQGALLNLDGVSEAKVYENDTNVTDADGIPAHSIWTIVEGGANTDIADAIYRYKTAGAGMRGSVTVDITTSSGQIKTMQFDRPIAEDLYIRFDIQPTITGQTFDQTEIKEYIVTNKEYQIGEFAETANLTGVALDAINETSGGGVPVNLEISLNGSTWVDYLETSTLQNQFTLDVSRITITEL